MCVGGGSCPGFGSCHGLRALSTAAQPMLSARLPRNTHSKLSPPHLFNLLRSIYALSYPLPTPSKRPTNAPTRQDDG